jgi:hypothetical protein
LRVGKLQLRKGLPQWRFRLLELGSHRVDQPRQRIDRELGIGPVPSSNFVAATLARVTAVLTTHSRLGVSAISWAILAASASCSGVQTWEPSPAGGGVVAGSVTA